MQTHPLRYVVLHHTRIAAPHFDLMIEMVPGEKLSTWRVTDWPPRAGSTFTPLSAHRRDFLTFEGPLTGNRGVVQRIVEGNCSVEAKDALLLNVKTDSGLQFQLPNAVE